MRILYFLAHPQGVGGASNVLIKQAHLMKKTGHVVKIIIQDDKNGNHNKSFDVLCEKLNLEYDSYAYSIAVCIEEIDILKSLGDIENIYTIIDEFNPDLIHTVQLNTTVELVTRNINIPHLMSIYPISKGMFNIPWTDVFPEFHMGDAEFYCKQWAQGLDITSKCIRVNYECTNSTDEVVQRKAMYELVSIGVLTSYKNQLAILKFLKLCKDSGLDVHMYMLGDDSLVYGDICRRYVLDNNISDCVDFCGNVTGVEKYLRTADAFIHVSKAESYPGVLVEAMANKTPVLITSVGGISELALNGVNAIIIDGFEAIDIYAAFIRFLDYQYSGELLKIVEEAFRTYQEHHTNEVIQNELENYYKNIFNSRNIVRKQKLFATDIEDIFKQYDVDKMGDQYIKGHIWFIHHMNEQIKNYGYRTCKIWGAGEYGEKAYILCRDILNIELIGILDKSRDGKFNGYSIQKPEGDFIKEADVIVVAIANIDVCASIGRSLEEMGRKRNVNYFFLVNDPCIAL